MWLTPADAERAAADGIEIWDVYEFMLRQLEAVTSMHLDRFVPVDEVAASLAALEDVDADPMRVARVMRRLVAAGVSVKDLAMIAAAVRDLPDDADIQAVVEHVRERMGA